MNFFFLKNPGYSLIFDRKSRTKNFNEYEEKIHLKIQDFSDKHHWPNGTWVENPGVLQENTSRWSPFELSNQTFNSSNGHFKDYRLLIKKGLQTHPEKKGILFVDPLKKSCWPSLTSNATILFPAYKPKKYLIFIGIFNSQQLRFH